MKSGQHRRWQTLLPISLSWMVTTIAFAQNTAFTYQGKLTDGTGPANGQYDLQFKLVDSIHFAETSDGVALVCPATLLSQV